MKVKIIERLEKVVEVDAGTKAEALRVVFDEWKEGRHILDADDFSSVDFETDEEWVPDFIMCRNLKPLLKPQNFGVSTREEVELITKTLRVDERNVLSLRNLRNFVVASDMFDMDCVSAITCVIDNHILDKGGEV